MEMWRDVERCGEGRRDVEETFRFGGLRHPFGKIRSDSSALVANAVTFWSFRRYSLWRREFVRRRTTTGGEKNADRIASESESSFVAVYFLNKLTSLRFIYRPARRTPHADMLLCLLRDSVTQ
eukprot:scaffold180_cov311-Pinguiococcus_pyrenoidosus.AAC.40